MATRRYAISLNFYHQGPLVYDTRHLTCREIQILTTSFITVSKTREQLDVNI